MIPAEICRAALAEAGRPDLAAQIGTNRAGHPMRCLDAHDETSARLVAKAFALAHGRDADYVEDFVPWLLKPVITVDHVRLQNHWSPWLCRWCYDFDPNEWAERRGGLA